MTYKPDQQQIYVLPLSALCELIDELYLDGAAARDELPKPILDLVCAALGISDGDAQDGTAQGWYFADMAGCEMSEAHALSIACLVRGLKLSYSYGNREVIHLMVQKLQDDGHLPAGNYVVTRK